MEKRRGVVPLSLIEAGVTPVQRLYQLSVSRNLLSKLKNREIRDNHGTNFFDLWEFLWFDRCFSFNVWQKNSSPTFWHDPRHFTILEISLCFVQALLKARNAPTYMRLSGSDGLTRVLLTITNLPIRAGVWKSTWSHQKEENEVLDCLVRPNVKNKSVAFFFAIPSPTSVSRSKYSLADGQNFALWNFLFFRFRLAVRIWRGVPSRWEGHSFRPFIWGIATRFFVTAPIFV